MAKFDSAKRMRVRRRLVCCLLLMPGISFRVKSSDFNLTDIDFKLVKIIYKNVM